MSVQFFPSFFHTSADVLDDIKANGTWPTTFVSGPSEEAPVHWHSDEVHAYIMEGETYFFDEASGKRTQVTAGDKVVVPARTLHAEGAVKGRVVYILSLPQALPGSEFLAMREPNDL